jgi:hypothetical protein
MSDRPFISRLRDRVLGPRTLHRDAAMSGLQTLGDIERAKFTPDQILAPPPPGDWEAGADVPWELRDDADRSP